jgi:hypothetical protein
MRSAILPLAALIALSAGAARADDPPKPPELKVLDRLVGTWDEVLTNKPTEWTPKAERSTSVTKKSWALGGRFVRMEGAWMPAKTEFVSYITFDPSTREYRTWYFDAANSMPRGSTRGTWDEAARTITWAGTDEAGNKMTGKTTFHDADTQEWTVVTTDPGGKVVLDLTGKITRRKE